MDFLIRKIWDKYGMFSRLDRRKTFLKSMAAKFRFAKLHLNKA